jgi:hypothetical protein
MKIHIITIMAIGFIAMIACNGLQQNTSENNPGTTERLKSAEWLIGKWENEKDGIHVTEIWEKGKNAYYGRSYSMRNNDTISSESIQLVQEGDKLLYVPVVRKQNEGKRVVFTLSFSTDNQLVFENPQHDFPQKILYTLINNDSLLAEISGTYNGKQQSEKFPMSRAK